MNFPLKFATALVLLAFPLLEIALLIKAGAHFGFWPVCLVVILTAVAGGSVIRAHGLAVFSRLAARLEQGGSGLAAMADTLVAVTGGLLLISPGLIGDVIGASLIIPAVRHRLVRAVLARFSTGGLERGEGFKTRPSRQNRGEDTMPDNDHSIVIEGEYERIDDEAEPKNVRRPQPP